MEQLMNQPTDGQRQGYREPLLWLLLIVGVLLGELLYRGFETRLSGNIEHIKAIPSAFEELLQAPSPRIAFIGNSLVNEGIKLPLFERLSGTSSVKVVPDGTSFWDWQCLINQNILAGEGPTVDMAVIGFAWHQISDQYPPDPSSLGGYMCEGSEVLSPASLGLQSFDQIAEFIVSYGLKIYANRDTVRNRILDLLIPDFRRFARLQNASSQNNSSGASPNVAYTYSHFTSLINDLRNKGVEVAVVSMPVQQDYQIPEELVDTLESTETPLLDYRYLDGINSGSFADEMHLNGTGRTRLTSQLAADLRPLIKD